MEAHDIEGARSTVEAVFSLLTRFSKQGVFDNDPILRKNFGFVGERAVQIDTGKLKIDPTRPFDSSGAEIYDITRSFRTWLETRHPQLVSIVP
jgi:hypothetical protein